MARQIGYGALTVTDVTDGINNATVYLYQRFASVTGHTPPANNRLTYNFTTGKLTGATADFNGWSQTIPNGNDPLYVVTAVATSVENTYIIPAWNDETRLVVNGEDGIDGIDGTSITAVREVYYFTTGTAPAQSTLVNGTPITSESTAANQWSTVVPAYIAGGHYYTSLQTSMSKGTSPVFSVISLNQALTDANNNAAIAKSIALANEENAQGALAISQGLESRLRYIWVNLNDPSSLPSDITKTTSYLGGTYAASGIDRTVFVSSNPSTYGWNSLLRHDKLMFRYNGIALTTLGIDGLKLYAPVVSNNVVTDHRLSITMTAGNSGALTIYNPVSNKAGMVLNSSGLTFYKYNTTNLEAAATLNGTGLNITAGSIKLGDNFEATSEGVITAKSGTVGNLHITNSSLYTGTHSAYNSAVAGIFINDTYISFGSGAVTYFKNDGSAKIGNWRFNTAGTQYSDSAAISSSVTKQGRIYLAPGNVNTTSIAIGIGTRTDSSADYSWPCYMRGDGYFYASNGKIGPWTVSASAIYHTKTSRTETTNNGVWLGTDGLGLGKGVTYFSNDGTGKIGPWFINDSSISRNSGGTAAGSYNTASNMYFGTSGISLGTAFKVSAAGALTATEATIEGIIRAKSGYIGYGATHKIAIGTNTTNASIYSGSHSALNSAADGFYIGADGIAIGSYNSTSGIVSCPFQVTSAGYLTARYGRIGKFIITNTYLYSGTGSNQAGMGADSIAFWAGSNTETSAPFRVSYGGALTATNATITGTINAHSFVAYDYYNSTYRKRVVVDTAGLKVLDTDEVTEVAKFGSTSIQLGKYSEYHVDINNRGLIIGKQSGTGNGGSLLAFNTYFSLFSELLIDITSSVGIRMYGNLDLHGGLTATGLLKSTQYSNTVTIGSQNSSYCHIYTDAAQFAFNKGFAMVDSGTLGDTYYPVGQIYMKNDGHLYGKETGGTARALIWLSTSNTVNIGNSSNPTYVNGTSFSGSKSYTGSDLRLKHSIIPLDERSFELLMRMKPFEYEWNEGEEHYYSKGKCFGLGAQEVLEALEEVGYTPSKYRVVERDPDGYYAVSYIELIPHLIYAIQKQQHEIDKLKEVINVHYS